MPYDSKCLDLAQYFLGCVGDEGDETQSDLAQTIQDAIKDWFEARENSALRKEASAAWDKCEERRIEAASLSAALSAVKADLLLNEPQRLGSILRKIDAALSKAQVQS